MNIKKTLSKFNNFSSKKKLFCVLFGFGFVGVSTISLNAYELILHPPKQPWFFKGFLHVHDKQSVRRGFQVYQQVCASCHSVKDYCFRHLNETFCTSEEAKDIAAEAIVTDGPDNKGNMFTRPGKLFDALPLPYANDNAAKAANNGALPPDLSHIVLAREGGEDYVFSLLTGYCDPPPGEEVDEGMYYNPYFVGGKLSMEPPLSDSRIEYDDGTVPSKSQLAKDVVTFLSYLGNRRHEDRNRMGLKFLLVTPLILPMVFYIMKLKWSVLQTRKLIFVKPTKKPRY
ncbi:Complex III subunit 4 [Intoshia linei]|uniref:Complex III subunit 4 n=1 Tax=Intoshia linei TaxID=1819745 RepID=A0A177BAH2_9BILA|nr:Complex III subunit 4 [Intoshia linei]